MARNHMDLFHRSTLFRRFSRSHHPKYSKKHIQEDSNYPFSPKVHWFRTGSLQNEIFCRKKNWMSYDNLPPGRFMMGRQGDMFIFIITLRIHGESAMKPPTWWTFSKRFDHTIRFTSFFKSWPFDSPSWRSRVQPRKGHKNGLKRGHFEEPGTCICIHATIPLVKLLYPPATWISLQHLLFFCVFFSLAAWFLRYSRQQTLMSSLYFFFVPTWVSLHLRHHSTTFLLSNSLSAAWSIP